MKVDLPDFYNAATTFVDDNIAQGRGGEIAIYYQDENPSRAGSAAVTKSGVSRSEWNLAP
jgi:hypothetical protein